MSVQHTRPINGAAERCSIKQALCCCPVQTTHAHTVTLCCPLNVPVTTATVMVFSCCLDNARVLHCLIWWDEDVDTSERRKATLCFGKEVVLACIDLPSDLSLFTRLQKNRDLINLELNCKSSLSCILRSTHTCTCIKWLAWMIFFPRCYYLFRAMLVQRTWCCVIWAPIVIAHCLRVSVSVQ